MNRSSKVVLLAPWLWVACSTTPARPTGGETARDLGVAAAMAAPSVPMRAAARPFRVRSVDVLPEGGYRLQARGEDTSESSGGLVSVAHGLLERTTIDAQVANGHQFETIDLGEEPGIVFDFGLQQHLFGERGRARGAVRLDVVAADEQAFEGRRQPPGFTSQEADFERDDSAKVSFQPSFLFGLPLGGGAEFYGQVGARFGDNTEPALAVAGGVSVPVGGLRAFLESDAVFQNLPVENLEQVYLTPGIMFPVREHLDLAIGPSFGLTEDAYDWRVLVTLGVRF